MLFLVICNSKDDIVGQAQASALVTLMPLSTLMMIMLMMMMMMMMMMMTMMMIVMIMMIVMPGIDFGDLPIKIQQKSPNHKTTSTLLKGWL